MDLTGGGHKSKKAKGKSDGKKSAKDENPSQKGGNDQKEESKKEKRGRSSKNDNGNKKGSKKRKSGRNEEVDEEDDENANKEFEEYLLQKERDTSSKTDKSNLLKEMKIAKKEEAALKVRMRELMKQTIDETGKKEENTKEDSAATENVESLVGAGIDLAEEDCVEDDEPELLAEEQEKEEQQEQDDKEEEKVEEGEEKEEEPEMKEQEKEDEDKAHETDNITTLENTVTIGNAKISKSVTFQDQRMAYISKGVKEKATKESNTDENDEEKGNNIMKTGREQVTEGEEKDRKEPDEDETKKEKGNSTHKTDGQQVAQVSSQTEGKDRKEPDEDETKKEKGNSTHKTDGQQVAQVSSQTEGKDRKEPDKDESKKEKGNSSHKTDGQQVAHVSSQTEGKDRKERDEDESKKEKGNITQKTDGQQVAGDGKQVEEASVSDPTLYTTENIAELQVTLSDKEHGTGILDVGEVKLKPGDPMKDGRHTSRKKKISPRRVVQEKQEDKQVRRTTNDPEYIPHVEPHPSTTRRESKRIKDRAEEAEKVNKDEDEDDIPLARLRTFNKENKVSDEKLSKQHNLKICSVSVKKMRVATKAELKQKPASVNWFENLQRNYDERSQELACDFDDDEEDFNISTECTICGHRSHNLDEHLEHSKGHNKFYCDQCLSHFLGKEEYDHHNDQVHGMNMTDNTAGFAQDLIRGTENSLGQALVQVGDTVNKKVSAYCLSVVVEDSPPKKSPVKEIKSEPSTQPTPSEEQLKALISEGALIHEYTKEYKKVHLTELPSLSEDTEKADTCDSEADAQTSDTTYSTNESLGDSKIPEDKNSVVHVTESQPEDDTTSLNKESKSETTFTIDSESKILTDNKAEQKLPLTDSQSGEIDEGTKDERDEKKQEEGDHRDSQSGERDDGTKDERDEKKQEEGDNNTDSRSGKGDRATSESPSKISDEKKQEEDNVDIQLGDRDDGTKDDRDEKKQEEGDNNTDSQTSDSPIKISDEKKQEKDNVDSQSGERDDGTKDERDEKKEAEGDNIKDSRTSDSLSKIWDEKKQEEGDNLQNIDCPRDVTGSVTDSLAPENLTHISLEIETLRDQTYSISSVKEEDNLKRNSESESDCYHDSCGHHDSSSYKESDHKDHENDKRRKHLKRKRTDEVGLDSDTSSPILRKRPRTRKLESSKSDITTASSGATTKATSNVSTRAESGDANTIGSSTGDSGIECGHNKTRKRDSRLRQKKPLSPTVIAAVKALKKARAKLLKKPTVAGRQRIYSPDSLKHSTDPNLYTTITVSGSDSLESSDEPTPCPGGAFILKYATESKEVVKQGPNVDSHTDTTGM